MNCPVCYSECTDFIQKEIAFLECPECFIRIKDRMYHPDSMISEERYRLHNNSPDNAGYLQWMSRILVEGVYPFIDKSSRFLDYGCGPTPIVCDLLSEKIKKRTDCHYYDPIFFPELPIGTYDLVLCSEVVEHFTDPLRDWNYLNSFVSSGGILTVSTYFAPLDREEFINWWYINDITHLVFYTLETLRKLSTLMGMTILLDNGKNLIVYRKLK